MELCETALAFAKDHLEPSGSLIMKFYGSQFAEEFRKGPLQESFAKVQAVKPLSSRKGQSWTLLNRLDAQDLDN